MSNFVINYKNGFTPVGYTAPESLTYQEWLQAGETIKRIDRMKNFAMGDWIIAGERKFGQMYSQAMDDFEWGSYHKVAKLVWVAKQIPPSRRRPELTWTHHHHVAKFTPEVQDYWLQYAIDNQLNSEDLRESIAMELNRQLAEAKQLEQQTEPEEETREPTPPAITPTPAPLQAHDDVMETADNVRLVNHKRWVTTIGADLPIVMKDNEHEAVAIWCNTAEDTAAWTRADHCLQVQNEAMHLRDLYHWPPKKYEGYYIDRSADVANWYRISREDFERMADTARMFPKDNEQKPSYCRRRQNETLTYKHHELLRNRSRHEAEYYLQRATVDGWTAERLAEELKGINNEHA